jgi:hypothetical protein
MNERIKELSEQAETYAEVNFKENPTWSVAFESKFADLIIQECVTVLEQLQDATDRQNWPTPYGCAEAIKEHFEVEGGEMTYKAEVSCGPVLTQPKETNISTATLLGIYRFASSIEPYLASNKSDMPDYLLDECCALIDQLNVMIIARTNTQSSPKLDPSNWGRIDSEGNFGAGK